MSTDPRLKPVGMTQRDWDRLQVEREEKRRAEAYPELLEALDHAEAVYAILCSDQGGDIPARIIAVQEHVSAWRAAKAKAS